MTCLLENRTLDTDKCPCGRADRMASNLIIMIARLVVTSYSTPRLCALPPDIPRSTADVYNVPIQWHIYVDATQSCKGNMQDACSEDPLTAEAGDHGCKDGPGSAL